MTQTSLSYTREQKIYLALWRKAQIEDREISVTLRSYNEAISMRMAMYRTIRPYRTEKIIDEDLRLASERFVISVLKDSKVLTLKPRNTLTAAELAMAEIGLTEEDLLTPEEKILQNIMEQKLDEILPPSEDSDLPKSNPFYSR